MAWGGRDVVFDYDGALQLARDLWSGAESVVFGHQAIDAHAVVARNVWLGAHADVFDERHQTTMVNAGAVAGAMQEEALAWATAWKQAVDEQNRINRARAVEAERARRSLAEKIADHFVGDDSDHQIRPWVPVSIPSAPDFTPTGGIQRF